MALHVQMPYGTIKRSDWKAVPVNDPVLLQHPINHICVSYTGSEHCILLDECNKYVKSIQTTDMKENKPDIQYSFLIGADNMIYEGTGWAIKPSVPEEFKEFDGKAIHIGFIGPKGEPPHPGQSAALGRLLACGKLHKYIEMSPMFHDEGEEFYDYYEEERAAGEIP